MTGYQFLQAKRILSCYNNLEQVNENLKDVGLLHESIEDTETPGYQELEDEGLVNDFDQDNVEKGGVGSEGSRGGKVIGHTRSGKPIYAHRDPNYHKGFENWSKEDHKDAAEHHSKHSKSLDEKAREVFKQGKHDESAELASSSDKHKNLSKFHQRRSEN